jgi:gamma-glutamyltranspeptidase/glutathione hydrolase/leukotriene-C4 hydrolase
MTVRIPPTSPEANSSVYVVDFRETAPALATPTMFQDNPISGTFGALSVGVPGEVLGMEEAHKRWGRMPWNDLVQPSVELAKGWEVDAQLAERIPVSMMLDRLHR